MIEAHQLVMFIAAGWLLNLTPGPDVLYIASQSARHGLRAGLLACAGIMSGCMVHVAAAAIGVSALLAASATAFTVLKWVGAAYLLWMGVKLLFTKNNSNVLAVDGRDVPISSNTSSLRRVYWGGFATNVLNPKVAIFFLAFIPQFIAPAYPHKSVAFAALGLLFALNSIPVVLLWAVVGARLSQPTTWLPFRLHWLDRSAGAMFIAFGLKLALTDKPAP